MNYVLSDIHGNIYALDSILEQINLQSTDKLYVLGDVIDRHPYGLLILQKLMKMNNVKMIIGNHEWMMLRALDVPYKGDDVSKFSIDERIAHWYSNGGQVTHVMFNDMPLSKRSDVIDYLHNLDINIDVDVNGNKFKLVHSAPLELYEKYGMKYSNEVEFSIWDRDSIYLSQQDNPLEYNIIFGHTVTSKFMKDPVSNNIIQAGEWIGIDCGAGYPNVPTQGIVEGRLACLRLEDMQDFYSMI